MATVSRTFSVRNGLDVANTIVLDSNRNLSNVNVANVVTVNATNFVTTAGLDVVGQANAAYAAANAAANTVRVSQNSVATLSAKQLNFINTSTITVTVNDSGDGNANVGFIAVGGAAYDQANAAYAQANAAYAQANSAYGQANDAYAAANTANTNALNAYAQANAAYSQANAAYSAANTANTNALNAYAAANAAYGQANAAYGQANNAYSQANDAYAAANTANTNALAAYAQANAAYGQANAAYGQANAAYGQANAALNQANAAYGQANAAYDTANLKVASINVSGNGLAVSNTTTANLNDYVISINTASTTLRGTTLLIDVVDSTDTGNAATANAVKTAWDYANTKLSLNGGTLGGSLNISGNLSVTGNTKYINVETYIVTDPLIYLAANNDTSDLVDIGFMGGHNTAGVYQHSGLARHAADQTWYLFTGLAEEGHENNIVDIANTKYALLKANLYAQQLNVVNGFVNVATTLTVGGNTTLSNVVVNGLANVVGDLIVSGTTIYSNVVTYTAAVNVNSTLTVSGTTTLANTNVNGVLNITNSGEGLVVGNANVIYTLTVGSLAVKTNTVTTLSSGQVVLDTFPASQFASAKYFVQANSGMDYMTTEVVLVQDTINVWLTEYGTIQTGQSLGTFTADLDSGNVRLLFTANNNVNTIRSVRYSVLSP